MLVTRPKPKGEILCEKIRAQGGEAIYFPTIEIAPPNDTPDLERKLAELQQYDWAIFVSPQAVYRAPILPANLKIAAIGEGTAQALREKGFTIVACPQDAWNSEALLKLPEFQDVAHKKIAILKGENGRELLIKEFSARGAQVTPVDVYQRVLPKVNVDPYLDLLRNKTIDVIICTSNDGLQNLKILLNAAWSNLQNVPVLVISERMLTQAKDLGFKKIIKAQNPSYEAILDALAKGKSMTDETTPPIGEKTQPRKHLPWNAIGIGFSTFAVIVMIVIFYLTNAAYLKNAANTAAAQSVVTNLQQETDSLKQQVSKLTDDLQNQSQVMNALRQTQSGYNRNEWRVLEAEFLVQIANDKLQFENNKTQAITLLQYADQQIRDLNDDRLLVIRKALANDIASLQAAPQVDISGLYLRLSAVNEEISKLTLPNKPAENAVTVQPNGNLPWWKRGLQETWQALRQIVTVHHYEKGAPALIMPEQQDFLFQNLHADMEKAMWALLHQQSDIYRASLDQAINWIGQYFMADSQPVKSVLTTLNELKAVDIRPTTPKIAESVQAFHAYFVEHNVQDTQQPAPAKQ